MQGVGVFAFYFRVHLYSFSASNRATLVQIACAIIEQYRLEARRPLLLVLTRAHAYTSNDKSKRRSCTCYCYTPLPLMITFFSALLARPEKCCDGLRRFFTPPITWRVTVFGALLQWLGMPCRYAFMRTSADVHMHAVTSKRSRDVSSCSLGKRALRVCPKHTDLVLLSPQDTQSCRIPSAYLAV